MRSFLDGGDKNSEGREKEKWERERVRVGVRKGSGRERRGAQAREGEWGEEVREREWTTGWSYK